MKWTFILALSFAIIAGCEKSNVQPELEGNISTRGDATTEKNPLLGKWRLSEYFQDIGDGTGQWVTASSVDEEEITFTSTGELIASENSHLRNLGYNRYRVVDANVVELYSTLNTNKALYYFNRETETSLIFNPKCRENCSRRYKRIG